ncbi:MAG TPA: amidohydrolase family protein [Acidimicrobiales bacterium]|nr:amidohydrolase family protein [Acidimicrobiales bacterium]
MAEEPAFIYVHERRLPYETFDSDNHLYERQEALTKYIPRDYEGIIKYVDVNGRTKLAIADHISDYIPNPTFARVAVPGGFGNDVTRPHEKERNPGLPGVSPTGGAKVRAMPSPEAFFDPEPRLELMKDMGIDRTLLWPTLASVVEERLVSDPDAAVAVVHALNQWMHEHWTYAYSDAIYATPIVSLAAGNDRAIEELEYVHERGAKIFLLRVAPVPTWKGRRSFALPEFDPFWARVQELDIVVGMHSGDPGYTRYTNEWEGLGDREFRAFVNNGSPGFLMLASDKNPVVDACASIIGHGLATRFPRLKFMPVEYWAGWVRPFVAKLQRASEKSAVLFDEDPFAVFTRNVWVHTFHEPDPQGLIDLGLPADHLMFGSDFPHPEGMADPLAYSEVVSGMPLEDQALIMGGSLAKAMKVGQYAA